MNRTLITLAILISPLLSAKTQKAIFGSDNRRDIYLSPAKIQKLASGVANWTAPIYVEENGAVERILNFETLEDHYGLCKSEKFSQQPTAMISCTGFLVAPQLLMTAGHCMVNVGEAENERTPMCTDFNWLFDYYYKTKKHNILKTQANNIVECKKVLFAKHTEEFPERYDFALIKLKRPLTNRHIFKLSSQKVKVGSHVALLGFPSGIPMKYSGKAVVTRAHDDQFFEATTDAFGGNSGSPAFNSRGEVVGILVRGNADFVLDKKKNCDRWNKCVATGKRCSDGIQEQDYNSGMHIQRITPELLKRVKSYL